MSDIVEQLRREAETIGEVDAADPTETVEWEAADEIERLRKELADATQLRDVELWNILGVVSARHEAQGHPPIIIANYQAIYGYVMRFGCSYDRARSEIDRLQREKAAGHEGGGECWQWTGARRGEGEKCLTATACADCRAVIGDGS